MNPYMRTDAYKQELSRSKHNEASSSNILEMKREEARQIALLGKTYQSLSKYEEPKREQPKQINLSNKELALITPYVQTGLEKDINVLLAEQIANRDNVMSGMHLLHKKPILKGRRNRLQLDETKADHVLDTAGASTNIFASSQLASAKARPADITTRNEEIIRILFETKEDPDVEPTIKEAEVARRTAEIQGMDQKQLWKFLKDKNDLFSPGNRMKLGGDPSTTSKPYGLEVLKRIYLENVK